MSAVADGWEATEAAVTAWAPGDLIDWDAANGPVRTPLAVLSNPAGWSHSDWPEPR